ncbi:hypothetical protein [Larkinella terrae]|uniref:Uncharacterized protein n=1 Tax=Larkinella terrae TaxID=2025311 RepID=A0A7K0EIW7_9BACT|nr:hypothetical protein [Larkinella terrae]MRS61757.1 hypothetical protein [Larkinella terrae]
MTTTPPKLPPAKRDTYGLILQGLKFVAIEHYDQMGGSGSFRQEQKFHLNKLIALFEKDQASLYRLIQQHGDGMELNAPFYDAIDLVREMIETAASLSQQQNPEGGTVGIPLMRQILAEIRAGNFATVEELPEGVQSVKQLNTPAGE